MTDDAATVREALEVSHARMCGDGHAWRECEKCRNALAALDRLATQAARADRYEEALRRMQEIGARWPLDIAREALDAETADA